MSQTFSHTPVLANEVIAQLSPSLDTSANTVFVDCTLGGGGHTQLVAQGFPNTKLIGIDQDPAALSHASEALRLHQFDPLAGNFRQLTSLLSSRGLPPNSVNAILYDLGVSSHQLDTAERGFSFQQDGPLDMRMDPNSSISAFDIVNEWPESELFRIIREFGQERHAARIARVIVAQRQQEKLKTTRQLANLIHRDVAKFYQRESIHPATRTFQALRIEVNGELDAIKDSLQQTLDWLAPGARLLVISFHSLEDRLVKNFFRYHSRKCVCPPEVWQCQCHHEPRLKIITRKPIVATAQEQKNNPRSRSAKLRVAQRTHIATGE
ncbi:16S rRNA (cytosine(1402)-N(4))-methyltransferase RsmH [Desulfurispira natronophila]|uniref:Ribosomal RNA small subunit methyltransferase H n=1 Tax=Desulfurispira natronophila TaxID=682562 RepID=A0A7W7Y3I3_9BACT|nr:16S rRNA (cytosine(1402)-N(4))-methyltransferase RsmH [Desulfurispira natronophila]MBB5021382.1 16S rRNA (cytosine1402-N4)-methyltransferase [Desulfurispira natronophila]